MQLLVHVILFFLHFLQDVVFNLASKIVGWLMFFFGKSILQQFSHHGEWQLTKKRISLPTNIDQLKFDTIYN